MKKGIFITFEGNDGAGKTTICLKIKEELEKRGYPVVYTREPGGSKIAEEIREILLDTKNTEMDQRTEALLYAASRRQHLVEKVVPALNEGKIVLCDRFVDSSLAYQGYARGIGMDEVWQINQFAISDYMPQKTLFLSVSMETGQKRMNIRGDKNRLDLEANDFHQKVRKGYDTLIEKYPDRIVVIDAEPSVDVVFKNALDQVMKVIESYE
ncbi:dTMP kinase [Floccifex sp.]|uniref:dTMP kinase n=1 Tax=Floccifex sp. TaxID=2815810 RepID=UPI002A74B8EB|nr:dTMP kinase [Floccifex sp.]MDD7282232.1 dTMP kinase [Erysipelotrichaceae bacterium]MDY2957757.1 dTMP kinase [Floccifex sp.]